MAVESDIEALFRTVGLYGDILVCPKASNEGGGYSGKVLYRSGNEEVVVPDAPTLEELLKKMLVDCRTGWDE